MTFGSITITTANMWLDLRQSIHNLLQYKFQESVVFAYSFYRSQSIVRQVSVYRAALVRIRMVYLIWLGAARDTHGCTLAGWVADEMARLLFPAAAVWPTAVSSLLTHGRLMLSARSAAPPDSKFETMFHRIRSIATEVRQWSGYMLASL